MTLTPIHLNYLGISSRFERTFAAEDITLGKAVALEFKLNF